MSRRLSPVPSTSEGPDGASVLVGEAGPEAAELPASRPSSKPERIYLRRREIDTPAKAAQSAHVAIVDWRVAEIRNALGQRFRSTLHVEVRRPWWMPGWLYERLMRSIVVETNAERVR